MKVWILILMDEPEQDKHIIGVYDSQSLAEDIREFRQDELLGGQYFIIMETEVTTG